MTQYLLQVLWEMHSGKMIQGLGMPQLTSGDIVHFVLEYLFAWYERFLR